MFKVLARLLLNKKATILARWQLMILDTYSADSAHFFKSEKDKFANPIGSIISESIGAIYDELIGEMNPDRLVSCLDNIIRVRAVQDLSPSEALAFITLLKKVARENLESEIQEKFLFKEFSKFERRIDDLMLLALDIYMKCREHIYEIKLKELRTEREVTLRLEARTSQKGQELGKA